MIVDRQSQARIAANSVIEHCLSSKGKNKLCKHKAMIILHFAKQGVKVRFK